MPPPMLAEAAAYDWYERGVYSGVWRRESCVHDEVDSCGDGVAVESTRSDGIPPPPTTAKSLRDTELSRLTSTPPPADRCFTPRRKRFRKLALSDCDRDLRVVLPPETSPSAWHRMRNVKFDQQICTAPRAEKASATQKLCT